MLTISNKTLDKDNLAILYLDGHIETNSYLDFENELNNILEKGYSHIILNCRDLQYINSAGLGVIMGLIEEVREKDGDIKLCAMNKNVFKIFDLVGFNQLFEIYEKEEEALNAFTQR